MVEVWDQCGRPEVTAAGKGLGILPQRAWGILPGKGWVGQASTTPPRWQCVWGRGGSSLRCWGLQQDIEGTLCPMQQRFHPADVMSVALLLLPVWSRRVVPYSLQGYQSMWGYF